MNPTAAISQAGRSGQNRRLTTPPAKPPIKPLSGPEKALRKLGLTRDIDLALHLPLRYEDETRIVPLADARDGETVQVEGQVTHSEISFGGRRQLRVVIDDASATCVLRFLNFYPSHQKTLSVGARVRVRGELRGGFMQREMVHPSFKLAGGPLHTALTPVYSTVAGLPQGYLRKAVLGGLERADLSETLAPELLADAAIAPVWNLRQALRYLHQPANNAALAVFEDRSHPAWQRLKAEELLAQQLSQLQARRERAAMRAPPLAASEMRGPHCTLHAQLLERLPFALTTAQQRVGLEIAADLRKNLPMHRLLQGDVGSGKTVVAALAAARCIDAGWQCALMAPTEILAEQHFRKMVDWLEPLGITTAWLTGSQKVKERREALALIASGAAALVVGTHAVIQSKVVFANLALAIIDEQHRFGVVQRLALRTKTTWLEVPSALGQRQRDTDADGLQIGDPQNGEPAMRGEPGAGLEPHLLMMTATPIPRTLAMSYYADLDVSTLDELPPGRTPVVTKLVNDSRRDEVVARIRTQLAEGRQIYWVCPLIEESEAIDLVNATQTHAALGEALPGVRVGLLHSRLPLPEKRAVMAQFVGGQMGVLVSTTVIEVGVDVPNASLMVIEHAERFGLSQLHQLRGRVGRGAAASACVLLYSTGDAPRLGQTARARLKAMAETSDGFEIARRDLEIRGPGEFLGARQSGAPLLRFADLTTDADLLAWARAVAPAMLDRHAELAQRHIARWLGLKAEFLKA
ncbi:MAG: ATP-dependent DNA helicase RecG [Polaromonas sp.]|nr:ATP-dependent DNA helicase RecG [Polaromonas sp.]